jgi:hypothetical protein
MILNSPIIPLWDRLEEIMVLSHSPFMLVGVQELSFKIAEKCIVTSV